MIEKTMTEQASLSEVRDYWEESSQQISDKDGLKPTARDPFLQLLVENAIERWLNPNSTVFDFGCGEGASTLRMAERVKSVTGIDFIDRYVELARKNALAAKVDNVSFVQGDVMDLRELNESIGTCEIAVSIRCLINLASWENQKAAIDNIHGTISDGGLYILSEGWSDGWDGLNLARQRVGLEPMQLVKYNRLLNRLEFEEHIAGKFSIVDYTSLGFYIFFSRLFHPYFVLPEQPKHLDDLNRKACEILEMGVGANSFPECDYAGVYVLRKL